VIALGDSLKLEVIAEGWRRWPDAELASARLPVMQATLQSPLVEEECNRLLRASLTGYSISYTNQYFHWIFDSYMT